jgi:hypothetical protein
MGSASSVDMRYRGNGGKSPIAWYPFGFPINGGTCDKRKEVSHEKPNECLKKRREQKSAVKLQGRNFKAGGFPRAYVVFRQM